jgi:hypothetical protein
MKVTNIYKTAPLLLAALSVSALAADNANYTTQGLDQYSKNFARHHMAANIFEYQASNQTFVPTEAAAAWLDDDIATGWPATTGKSYYLLSLAEPELVNNFALSAKDTTGTVSLYAADEPAPPTSKAWTPLAKDINVADINNKVLAHSFSHYGKYILIETNLSEAGPVYSLYLYGEKPAASYTLLKRPQTVDMHAILGSYVNAQTSINLASLYTQGRVISETPAASFPAMQKAIDDNPQTSVSIAPSQNESGMVVKLGDSENVQRISALTDADTKGKLELFMLPNSDQPKVSPVSTASTTEAASTAVSLENKTPIATITFDGTTARGSVDFPPVPSGELAVRWVPDTAGQPLNLREINVFSDLTLNDYQLTRPEAVAEYRASSDGKESSDGKDYKSVSGAKEAVDPVAEGPTSKSPFVPGPLSGKPILPLLPPETPVSP